MPGYFVLFVLSLCLRVKEVVANFMQLALPERNSKIVSTFDTKHFISFIY